MTGGLPLNLIHFLILQVLIAVGRDACTDKIGLDKAGVKVNPKYVYHLIVFFIFFPFPSYMRPSHQIGRPVPLRLAVQSQ